MKVIRRLTASSGSSGGRTPHPSPPVDKHGAVNNVIEALEGRFKQRPDNIVAILEVTPGGGTGHVQPATTRTRRNHKKPATVASRGLANAGRSIRSLTSKGLLRALNKLPK